MKRRIFLIALGVVPVLVLEACKGRDNKNKLPKTPTIISGYVRDEEEKPIKGLIIQFGGITGESYPKATFNIDTLTDEKGYYYLEKLIPEDTMSITFKAIENSEYSYVLYDYLCSVKESYQKDRPFVIGQKNKFNLVLGKV